MIPVPSTLAIRFSISVKANSLAVIFVILSQCAPIPDNLLFHEDIVADKAAFRKRLQQLQLSATLLFSNIFLFAPFDGKYIYDQQKSLFKDFTDLFERKYRKDNLEYQQRFEVFQGSLQRQVALRQKESMLNGTARYGINKFSDWTSEEFGRLLSKRTRLNETTSPENYIQTTFYPSLGNPCKLLKSEYPLTTDWRHLTTKIKNQKNCGSCWAFVGAEQVETYSAIKGGKLMELSPQQLISCATSLGCSGGNTCLALYWLTLTRYPLVKEKSYPYEERDSDCNYEKLKNEGVRIQSVCGCQSVVNDEEIMIRTLAEKGPLAVNVDAVQWHDYIGGVIQHHCSNQRMNHAVQIVGYDLKNGPVPYYIARNQWGSAFGEDGYVRIKYGANVCGVAEEPSYIVV